MIVQIELERIKAAYYYKAIRRNEVSTYTSQTQKILTFIFTFKVILQISYY